MRNGVRALRRGRLDVASGVYFTTAVTCRRVRWFEDFDTASIVGRIAGNATAWPDARLLAWVLMPDHWHGLVQLSDRGSLCRAVGRFKGMSAYAVNAHLQRRGALWMPGFHDRAIRSEDGIRAAARYLVANPLRAGLAASIGDYPFWDAVWL